MIKKYHNNLSAGKKSVAILQYIYFENFNHYRDIPLGQPRTKQETDDPKVKLFPKSFIKKTNQNLHSID